MYSIVKITRSYRGRLTVTREHTITDTASQADVDKLLAMPETYEGERAEALDDLASTGITDYHGYRIIEH